MTEDPLEERLLIPVEYRLGARDNLFSKIALCFAYQIPKPIRKHLAENKAKIVFCERPLTDLPEFAKYKGQIPEVYAKIGRTTSWEEVDGGYNYKFKSICMRTDKGGLSYLILHEIGHCIDDILGNSLLGKEISDKRYVTACVSKKAGILWEDYSRSGYWTDMRDKIGLRTKTYIQEIRNKNAFLDPKEFFAHCVYMRYKNETTSRRLKRYAPEMYFLMDLLERVLKNK